MCTLSPAIKAALLSLALSQTMIPASLLRMLAMTREYLIKDEEGKEILLQNTVHI